jgi:hypothetical protein
LIKLKKKRKKLGWRWNGSEEKQKERGEWDGDELRHARQAGKTETVEKKASFDFLV